MQRDHEPPSLVALPGAGSFRVEAGTAADSSPERARVRAFLSNPRDEDFGPLALDIARLQAARIPAYARICASLGVDPVTLDDWRSIPPIPTLAFKRERFCVEPARVVFRSSGTTLGAGGASSRSEHHQPWPELYDLAVDHSFPAACLPHGSNSGDPEAAQLGPTRVPMLSLIPPPRLLPDSSLSHMIGRVVDSWGDEASLWVATNRGVDTDAAFSWLERACADSSPTLVLTTAFALVELLEALATHGRELRLPRGSVLFETGGYKGRSRELRRDELEAAVTRHLGIPSAGIVREYGMSELSSQLYASALAGGRPDRFVSPPWVRVRVLDPRSLDDAALGSTGLVSILDLANAGSALHVLTEDLGRLEADGSLELVGRASNAELRGCSLTAETFATRDILAP